MELQEPSLPVEATGNVTPHEEQLAEQQPIADDVEVNTIEDVVIARQETMTKEQIVEAVSRIAACDAADISRDEVGRLKQQFYLLRHAELAAEKNEFMAAGNEEQAFVPKADELEDSFKAALGVIKEKKAVYAAALEAERQANLEKKNAIIEELKALAEDTDNVNRVFPQFRELQAKFKEIGEVPATAVTDQWKRYQDAVERFYDQLKINKDLRDYDFKKNLDIKLLLCDEAERLDAEQDVVVAFRRLQELHDKWRDVGPVAKEQREEIWNRFKDASAVINKKYQAFFEERKQREQQNEAAKTELCERIEALDFTAPRTAGAWDEMTKVILGAQEEWKKLGYASRKSNNALFGRFRATCDKFFAAKAEHFRQMKDELAANMAAKVALCEQAEALKDSTDWKATADKLVELQKQWKNIGAVAKRQSDAVWTRFQTACDAFFQRKKEESGATRRIEQANLKEKKAIIEKIKAISTDGSREDAVKAVRELQAEYQKVGHVPFREKDKLHESYREAVDAIFAKFGEKAERAGMAKFETAISELEGNEQKLLRERDRLMRIVESRRAEIQTFENNLGFFNAKSKSGDSMLRDMQQRIERLRADLASLIKKVELIDSKLK